MDKLKMVGIGIPINNVTTCVMLYVDDIVMLTQTETQLQMLVSILYKWSTEWQVSVNQVKTQKFT